MASYVELRNEYISLIRRSIRQKVFADEDTLSSSPDIINSILQKYSTKAVEIEFVKNHGKYHLLVRVTIPWKDACLQQIEPIDMSNPSLSLCLNLRDSLKKIIQALLETSVNEYLDKDFEDYFNTLEYREKFLKEETLKIINSIPEMKKESVFQLFLLKKENEYLLKWKEMKNKRLERIFDLQEQLEEAWCKENKIKNGEKVFIVGSDIASPIKGLVHKTKDYEFFTVGDFTKPYAGKIGYLENKKLFDANGHKCYNLTERSLFLNDEYTLNILPPLLKEMETS